MPGIPFIVRHQLELPGTQVGWPDQYRQSVSVTAKQPITAGKFGRQPFDQWANIMGLGGQLGMPARPIGYVWPWERDHHGVPHGADRRGVWFNRTQPGVNRGNSVMGIVGYNQQFIPPIGPTYSGAGNEVGAGGDGIIGLTNMGGGLYATRHDIWRRHAGPWVLWVDRGNPGEQYSATVSIYGCNASGLLTPGQMYWYNITRNCRDPQPADGDWRTTWPVPPYYIDYPRPCSTDPRLAKTLLTSATLPLTDVGCGGFAATDGWEAGASVPGGLFMCWMEVQFTGPIPPSWRLVDMDRLICDNSVIVPSELPDGWDEIWDQSIDRGGMRGGMAANAPWQTAMAPNSLGASQNPPVGAMAAALGGRPALTSTDPGHIRVGQADVSLFATGGNRPPITGSVWNDQMTWGTWRDPGTKSMTPCVWTEDGQLRQAGQLVAQGQDCYQNIYNDRGGAILSYYDGDQSYARQGPGVGGSFRGPAVLVTAYIPQTRSGSVSVSQTVTGPQVGPIDALTKPSWPGTNAYGPTWVGSGWRGGKLWYQLLMPSTGAPLETVGRQGTSISPAGRAGSILTVAVSQVAFNGWAGIGPPGGDCRLPPGSTAPPYSPGSPAPPCPSGYTWASSYFNCASSYPAQCGYTYTTPQLCPVISGNAYGLCRDPKGSEYYRQYDPGQCAAPGVVGGQYYNFELVGMLWRQCDFTTGGASCYSCFCGGLCNDCLLPQTDFQNFGILFKVGEECTSTDLCSQYSAAGAWVNAFVYDGGARISTRDDARYVETGLVGPVQSGHRGTPADAWAPGTFSGCTGPLKFLDETYWPSYYSPGSGCGAPGAIFGVISYYPGTDSDAVLRRCGLRMCTNQCGDNYMQGFTTTVGGFCSCGYTDQTGVACQGPYPGGGQPNMCPNQGGPGGGPGGSVADVLASNGWYSPLNAYQRKCDGGAINEVRIEIRRRPDWGIPSTTLLTVAELYAECSDLVQSIPLTPNLDPYSGGCYGQGQAHVCQIGATYPSNCSNFPLRYGWALPGGLTPGPCGSNIYQQGYYGPIANQDLHGEAGSVGVIDIDPIPCPVDRGCLVAFAVVDHTPMVAEIAGGPTNIPCNECAGQQPCTGTIPCPPQYEQVTFNFQATWLRGSFTLYLAPADDIPLPFATVIEDATLVPGGVRTSSTALLSPAIIIPYTITAFPYTQPTQQMFGAGRTTLAIQADDTNWRPDEVAAVDGFRGMFRFTAPSTGLWRVKVTAATPGPVISITYSPTDADASRYNAMLCPPSGPSRGTDLTLSASIVGKTSTVYPQVYWNGSWVSATVLRFTGTYYVPCANTFTKLMPRLNGDGSGMDSWTSGDGLLAAGQEGIFVHQLMPQCKPPGAPTPADCATVAPDALTFATAIRNSQPMSFELEQVSIIQTPLPGPGLVPLVSHMTPVLCGEMGGSTQVALRGHAFYTIAVPSDGTLTIVLAGAGIQANGGVPAAAYGAVLAASTVEPTAVDDNAPAIFMVDGLSPGPGIQAGAEYTQVPSYLRPDRPGNTPPTTAATGRLVRTLKVLAGSTVYVRVSTGYPTVGVFRTDIVTGNIFSAATLSWSITA